MSSQVKGLIVGLCAGLFMGLPIIFWVGLASLSPTPTPDPGETAITVTVLDDMTGQPVTATLTIRRIKADGTYIGGEDGEEYTGQQVTLHLPVDPNVRVMLLVEAEGYKDWEIEMVVKKPGTLDAPIRLKLVKPDTDS